MPILTAEEQLAYDTATSCHICGDDFKEGEERHRDHCHILQTFRGAAHKHCNVEYKIDPRHWKLPVYFHNLRGYDGHLIIKAMKSSHGPVRVIPNSMEKFMAFSVGQLQFLDSFQFTMQSLDELVKTLNDDDFKYTREIFSTDEQFYLMRQKGIFPYDFFDNIEKLQSKVEIQFPIRKVFYNKLEDKECSMKDYLHAKSVWRTFKCKTFADYHDLYLKCDVLLLTDFFEKFRSTCLDNYGGDAAYYYSAPGMAWDSALKMTKINLELFQTEEMYTSIEHSIRGGVTQITKRFAKANKP